MNKKEKTQSAESELKIYEYTKTALKGKTVTKQIQSFGRGHDSHIWKISGSEQISFIFRVYEYGKRMDYLQISIMVKAIPTNRQVSQEFHNIDFVQKMYNLFLEQERLMYVTKQQKNKEEFVKEFKENLK